jgi:hypothetical protein
MTSPDPAWHWSGKRPTGSVLVVPNALAAAYVPQMVCDLLIENLALPHLGSVQVPQVLPFAGRGRYSHTDFHFLSPVDMYACQDLAVVQHRSPIARGRSREHAFLLWNTFGRYSRLVLVLNSISAVARESDRALSAPLGSVWYLANVPGRAWVEAHAPEWIALNETDVLPAYWPLARARGWIAALFEAAAATVPLVVPHVFVHAGDNRHVAARLVESLARSMSWSLEECKEPPSWAIAFDANGNGT